jgi:hypothetical protein
VSIRDRELPIANPKVVWTSLSEGAVLFSNETELYYGLNGVGAVVWDLLPPASATVDQLCVSVHERFPDATLEQIRSDVTELLAELERFGLVVSSDES